MALITLVIDVKYFKPIDTALLKYYMDLSTEETLKKGMFNQQIFPLTYPPYEASGDERWVTRMFLNVYKILPDWIEEHDQYLKGNDPNEALHSYHMILDQYGDAIVRQFFPETTDPIEAVVTDGINKTMDFFYVDTAVIRCYKDELFPSLDDMNQYVNPGNHMGETVLNIIKKNYDIIDQSEQEGKIYRFKIKKKEDEENGTDD